MAVGLCHPHWQERWLLFGLNRPALTLQPKARLGEGWTLNLLRPKPMSVATGHSALADALTATVLEAWRKLPSLRAKPDAPRLGITVYRMRVDLQRRVMLNGCSVCSRRRRRLMHAMPG